MFLTMQICLILSLLVLIHAYTGCSMHTNYATFYIKTMRYSCLLGDKYKFTVNVLDEDKNTLFVT